jgi:uncharacterized protein YecA (UPF0149 family)
MVQLGELMMILELHRQGLSITAIARRTGRDPKTVRKYIERSIFPILALCGDENGESLLGIEPEDEDRIAAEAATLLPSCAMAIDDYWRRRKATHGAPKKPGQNDSCSCCSGNKFKKCCGR